MKTTGERAATVKTLWVRALLALCAAALTACGGGSDATKAHVRLVNASAGYGSLALSLASNSVQSGVAYGSNADYTQVDPSNTDATITSPSSASTLSSSTLSLSKKNYYTVLAYGKAGALSTLELDDNPSAPSSGKAQLRVINTAADAGALDVYLTGASDALSASTALLSTQSYGTLSGYSSITSGSWRLRVTAAGSKTDVRLDLAAVDFASQGSLTLVLTPGSGGVLVHGLLLAAQGGIGTLANNQARVRVVAGTTDNSSVSVTLGGSALVSAVSAPAKTAYTLVTAGTQALSATANGSAASLSSLALGGGGDYTLMLYGTPAAPKAVLLSDDNTYPSDATLAKLRLVHGLADVAGSLSMKVNYAVAADGVAPGKPSAYAAADASTTTQITVNSVDGSVLYNSPSTLTLLANANYTLFMVGSASTPVALLSKDR